MPNAPTRRLILFLLNNSIPLIGAFVYGWNALFVVQFCFIETFISSLFDFIKLPFLKNDPNGDPNQGGFTVLSVVLLPMLFLYAALMVVVLDTKLLAWEQFRLPACILGISYTAQFVHFMAFERFKPDLFRVDISQFSVLRDVILMGAIICLPWLGVLFLPIWNLFDIHFNLSDSYKVIIVLMLIIRTYFEIKLVWSQHNKQLALTGDL